MIVMGEAGGVEGSNGEGDVSSLEHVTCVEDKGQRTSRDRETCEVTEIEKGKKVVDGIVLKDGVEGTSNDKGMEGPSNENIAEEERVHDNGMEGPSNENIAKENRSRDVIGGARDAKSSEMGSMEGPSNENIAEEDRDRGVHDNGMEGPSNKNIAEENRSRDVVGGSMDAVCSEMGVGRERSEHTIDGGMDCSEIAKNMGDLLSSRLILRHHLAFAEECVSKSIYPLGL